MTISIVWHFGYIVNVWTDELVRLPLYCGRFFFYDKDKIIECNLDDAVMFDMNVDCKFHMRKTVDLTRNEIFAVRCKDRRDNYSLYIPLSQVDLKEIGNKVSFSSDRTDRYVYTKYSITAYNLCFWNSNIKSHSFVKKGDNSIIFTTYKGFNRTKKGKALDKLICDINQTCGLSINSYDYEWSKILQHYDIIKKKSVKKC